MTWSARRYYYVYGFMLLVFIILVIVSICITIVSSYFLLNAEVLLPQRGSHLQRRPHTTHSQNTNRIQKPLATQHSVLL